MSLSVDTTFLTRVCDAIGKAHNAYIAGIGGLRADDDGSEGGPFFWLEQVKSIARGGNDLATGLPVGTALVVAAQGSPDNTVNITGGNIKISSATVAVSTSATYGSVGNLFSQTCTDGSALTTGQFYDVAICADIRGTLTVIKGPREDRADTESHPTIPSGLCRLATVRVRFTGGASVINTADLTAGTTLTAYSAPADDAQARIFADFDAGQTRMLSRAAVKNELGFAFSSVNNYITTVTASQGLGTSGAGLTLLQWAKATHQTASPWDFPDSFLEFVRVLKNGKDPSKRLATIAFTGSGTATVTDLKKVVGFSDKFELVVTSVSGTGVAQSTVNVTVQSNGATQAVIWTGVVPASSPNGTVIAMTATGTAPIQTPLPGTAINAAIAASSVLAAQPAGTVVPKVWTALVPTSPVSVVGGTSGDIVAFRNLGTL